MESMVWIKAEKDQNNEGKCVICLKKKVVIESNQTQEKEIYEKFIQEKVIS